jgi:hypothetical protein
VAHKTVSKERTPRTGRGPSRSHSVPAQELARLAQGDPQGTRRMGKNRHDEGGTSHTSEMEESLRVLGTDAGSGLSNEEAARRLEERVPTNWRIGVAGIPGLSCGSSSSPA